MKIGDRGFSGDANGFFDFAFLYIQANGRSYICVENTAGSPRIDYGLKSLARGGVFRRIGDLDVEHCPPILPTLLIWVVLICVFQKRLKLRKPTT
jgi:hypothetical protein